MLACKDITDRYGTYEVVYLNGEIECLIVDTFLKYYNLMEVMKDPKIKYIYYLPLEFDDNDLLVDTIIHIK